MDKQIIGAGLAGLITACKIKDAPILEAGPMVEQHKALLRFRDRSVSDLIGIPFDEVSVRKEIFFQGKTHHNCSILLANMYSKKVAGAYQGRSIWDLDTVTRYVAPPDLYERLVSKHSHRIRWNSELSHVYANDNIQRISTIPLPAMIAACRMKTLNFGFSKSAINVSRFLLPEGTEVYQTMYFPDPTLRVFRSSITRDILIIESMAGEPRDEFCWALNAVDEVGSVAQAFGIYFDDLKPMEKVEQKYGKIVDIPRIQREAVLYELTRDFNVFSIGRFATWRNILLDDVVKDIAIVEKLMSANTYGRGLVLANR